MNPLLDLNTYIPDIEAHVFDNKLYLYGSHDKKGGDRFCMLDYEVFYSPLDDLKNFKSDGVSYKKEEDVIHRLNKDVLVDYYAPDCVKGNDGFYYLFYSAMGPNTTPFGPISVAKSSSPSGPFKYYGDIKYKNGEVVKKYLTNDPTVINDNGHIYLYYGWGLGRDFSNKFFKPLYNFVLSKLTKRSIKEIKNDKPSILSCAFVEIDSKDMLTALDEPKAVLPSKSDAKKGSLFYKHPFYEAPSIRKFNDYYYLIYSSNENGELAYAKSLFPDKEFSFGGVLISSASLGYKNNKIPKDIYGTIHGSIEKINDKYAIFYHRLSNQSDFQRRSSVEWITLNKNNDFEMVEMSTNGLSEYIKEGKVEAVRASEIYNKNSGRRKNKKLNAPYATFNNLEHYITNLTLKSVITFKYFNFIDINKINILLKGKGKGEVSLFINDEFIDKKILIEGDKWEKYEFSFKKINDNKVEIKFIFNNKKSYDFLSLEIIKGE